MWHPSVERQQRSMWQVDRLAAAIRLAPPESAGLTEAENTHRAKHVTLVIGMPAHVVGAALVTVEKRMIRAERAGQPFKLHRPAFAHMIAPGVSVVDPFRRKPRDLSGYIDVPAKQRQSF